MTKLSSTPYVRNSILMKTKNNKITKKSVTFCQTKYTSHPLTKLSHELNQKQLFQPFEYLYDHAEQMSMSSQLLSSIQECTERIEKLEHRITEKSSNIPSPPLLLSDMKSVFTHLLCRIDQLESKLHKV